MNKILIELFSCLEESFMFIAMAFENNFSFHVLNCLR